MEGRRALGVALIVGAVLAASVFFVVPSLVASKPEGPRRVLALDPKEYTPGMDDGNMTMSAVKVGDLKPNSFVWFLDPYGKTMAGLYDESETSLTLNREELEHFAKRDPFENYMLIRLPGWLGGAEDDAPAFRAYHAISISDSCFARYFPMEGRWRMENPCAGDMYRPWDGMAFAGPAAAGYVGGTLSGGDYHALQQLRLAVDSEGYIVAIKPDNSLRGDGVQGSGRVLSLEALKESNREMIEAAGEYAGYSLPFPTNIEPDYVLSERNAASGPWWSEWSRHKPPLQAVYSSQREYSSVIIDVFPTDQFADLRLGGPAVRPSGTGYAVNGTLFNELTRLYYDPSYGSIQFRNGTDIAGEYAILAKTAPLEREETGAGALVWGKSADGKDLLVAVHARDMSMKDLTSLVRGIGVR
jgi:hypothetical protein